MSTQNRIQIPTPCSHLTEFRSKHTLNPFRSLHNCLRVKPLGRAEILRDSLEFPICSTCNTISTRLYACVSCATVFCHNTDSLPKKSHVELHAELSRHEIAVDIDRAELFCCVCKDQVYDLDFDKSVVFAQSLVAAVPPLRQRRKRRRVEYNPWNASCSEEILIRNDSSTLHNVEVVGEDTSTTLFPWGLKGLNNLGNTCFMNSVLQVLIHTPPLRNYFLSDRHNRYICQKKSGVSNGSVGNDNGKISKLCLACDMDAVFSAMFSGDRMPYSPAKFLYSWWQHASNLASYEQQDAHEFFISMLDGIHEKVEKERGKPQSQGNGDCCIAHRVFSGILRSDVTCTACGFTSTTYDPCVDISLDLEPNQRISTKSSAKSQQASSNGNSAPLISTLMGCLDRFTRPERLGSDQKFFCQQCQVRQESLKQMSIRKLPLVSCFHIKRFEHSSSRNMSKKVDRYLQFPFSLDMSKYLSSSILRGRFGNRIFAFDDDESDASEELPSEFELFAVVTHTGKLDSGHYVTYLRLSNQWYKCDDAWVSQVSESFVRAAQAYMIFYVQKVFYYKASEKLGS
ncbi:ubiquitinyl hydrolase 1 [Ranunculus cassubicifolius]